MALGRSGIGNDKNDDGGGGEAALRHGGGDRIPFDFPSPALSSTFTTSSLYSTSTATSSPSPSNAPDSSSIQICGKLAIAQIHELVALFGQGVMSGRQVRGIPTTSVAPATPTATGAGGATMQDGCSWNPDIGD